MKKIIVRQYQSKVNQAFSMLEGVAIAPPEGWVRTVRNALGMSGAQLGRRLGVSRGRVSQMELDEVEGSVTLKTMEKTAGAMGCRFVYAIVPDKPISEVLKNQAIKKAKQRALSVSTHMALEDQVLSESRLEDQIERIASELIEKMPADLWNDE